MLNYSKSELLLLKYLNGFEANSRVPNYFVYSHHLEPDKCIKKFLKDQSLKIAPIDFALNKQTVSKLKELLSCRSLKTTGKKVDLVTRLLENASLNTLALELKNNYYALTDMGEKLVLKGLSDDEYENRYTNINIKDKTELLSLIKNCDFKNTESLLENSNRRIVRSHSNYKAYKMFLNSDLYLENHLAPYEEDLKIHLLLMYIIGFRYEQATTFINLSLDVEVPSPIIIKQLRTISSLDDLLVQKETAKNIPCFYTVQTTEDSVVCSHCKSLQGKKLAVKNAKIGVNYPPFDNCTCEYCRCFAEFSIE